MVKHIKANPLEDRVWKTYQLACYALLLAALALMTVWAWAVVSVVATWALMTW